MMSVFGVPPKYRNEFPSAPMNASDVIGRLRNSSTIRLAGVAEYDTKHPAAPSLAVSLVIHAPVSKCIWASSLTASLDASLMLWRLLLLSRYIPPHVLILRRDAILLDQILPNPVGASQIDG